MQHTTERLVKGYVFFKLAPVVLAHLLFGLMLLPIVIVLLAGLLDYVFLGKPLWRPN